MGWREVCSDRPQSSDFGAVLVKVFINASVKTEDRAIIFVDDMNLEWLAMCWVTESGPQAKVVERI